MKQFLIYLGMSLLLIGFASATTIMYDNFDSHSNQTETNYTSFFGDYANCQHITTEKYNSSPASLNTNGSGSSQCNISKSDLTFGNVISVRFRAYLTTSISAGQDAMRIDLRDVSQNNVMLFAFRGDNSRNLNIYNGTGYHNVPGSSPYLRWLLYEIRYNQNDESCDVYINDKLNISFDDCTFNNNNVDSIKFSASPSSNTVNFNVDDFQLCNGPCNTILTALQVYNCTEDSSTYLNLSGFHEDFPLIHNNITIEMSGSLWTTNKSDFTNYNLSFDSNKPNHQLCIEPNQEPSFLTDAIITHTTSNGFVHRYYLRDHNLSQGSFSTLKLYNFNYTTGTNKLRTTILDDGEYLPQKNIITSLQRYYVDTNSWRTVQMDRTGDFGLAIYNIIQDSVDYRLLFYDDDLTLLQTTSSLKFNCDPVTELCEISPLIPIGGRPVNPYKYVELQSVYNNKTDIVRTSYAMTDGSEQTIDLELTKTTQSGGTVSICSDTVTSSAGTFDCNVSAYHGPFLITAKIDDQVKGSVKASKSGVGISKFSNVFDAALWAIVIFVTMVGFGTVSPITTIIMALVSLITIFMLQLFPPLTDVALSVIMAAGILVAIKVRR